VGANSRINAAEVAFRRAIEECRTTTDAEVSLTTRGGSERLHPVVRDEVYRVGYNPDHAWFYFPRMRRDEALVFKVYDSETDGRARFTAHTSFTDPTTLPDAPPRQSIEVRTLAFFAPS